MQGQPEGMPRGLTTTTDGTDQDKAAEALIGETLGSPFSKPDWTPGIDFFALISVSIRDIRGSLF
jgi:hypothetical protein